MIIEEKLRELEERLSRIEAFVLPVQPPLVLNSGELTEEEKESFIQNLKRQMKGLADITEGD